jgi:SpoVK/Ycf46/Vps4 family AAA+-type ATPase
VKQLFERARANAPVILFLDELDIIARIPGRRGPSSFASSRATMNRVDDLSLSAGPFGATSCGFFPQSKLRRAGWIDELATDHGRTTGYREVSLSAMSTAFLGS